MKTRSYFFIGVILFLLGVAVPMFYLRHATDPRNPDAAEMESCCIAIPLVILSVLFILVGITRLIYYRHAQELLSIEPLD